MTKSDIKFSGWSTGVISPRLKGNSSFQGYQQALDSAVNYIVGLYGQMIARPGFQHIAEVKASGTNSYLFPFRYSNTDTYILEFTTNTIRVYEDRAQVQSGGSAYEITTTYAAADIPNIRIYQKFDRIFITHPDYAPRELTRISDANWTFNVMDLDEPAWGNTNTSTTTLTFSAVTGSGVTCTASANTFASTDVGRSIRFKAGPDDSDAVTYVNAGSSQVRFDIPFYPKDSTNVEVIRVANTGVETQLSYAASSPAADEFSITDGQVEINSALSSGQSLKVQVANTGSGQWGWATITGYTSATVVTVEINKDLGGTNASTEWRLGAWSDTTGYPALVTAYQGRLWFAKTVTQPDTIWGTEIENFYNLSPDNIFNKGQLDDSTGGSATLADINTIQFIEGLNVLMLGGEGLKSIGKGGTAVSFPPTVLPEDGTLCSSVVPVKNRNEILFTDAQRKTIYSAKFDFQTNSYKPDTINLLSDHYFEDSPIAEMVLVELPFPTLIVRTDEGKLYCATYKPEIGIKAWTSFEVGGTDVVVESIATIPNDNKSELWAVVSRTIDSATYRSIECLHNFFYKDAKTTAAFSDSYLTYSGSATSVLTGLGHLEGETVEVVQDGAYAGTYTVSGGEVDITPLECTSATVGLSYNKEFTTIATDLGRPSGVTKGFYSTATTCLVEMFETDGMAVQVNGGSENELNFRGTELTDGSVNPLFTGIKEIQVDGDLDRELKVTIKQNIPLPQTVLSVVVMGIFS